MDSWCHLVLIFLSEGCPRVDGRLDTCYSPVRRSPSICITTNHAAPRLACVKPVASVHPEPGSNSSLLILFIPFAQNLYLSIVVLTVCQYSYYVSCTTCWYVMLSKNSRYRFDCGCKGKNFFLTNKLFKENFESFFQSPRMVGYSLSLANLILAITETTSSSC